MNDPLAKGVTIDTKDHLDLLRELSSTLNFEIDPNAHPQLTMYAPGNLMPYRILCNGVKREYVSTCPDQASKLFCSVPLHKIRYGVHLKSSKRS